MEINNCELAIIEAACEQAVITQEAASALFDQHLCCIGTVGLGDVILG